MNVYTDGSCIGPQDNRRAGIGVYFGEDDPRNVSQSIRGPQTNQYAELCAILVALQIISNTKHHYNEINEYEIHTDSKYAINCVTVWIHNWRRNNWKTSGKKDVLHKETIIQIYDLLQNNPVKLKYVPGHSGYHGNEMADKLAVAGANIYEKTPKSVSQ